MLKVTGGEWHKEDPIPRAAGEDYFTSCLARDFKIIPYGRNIGVVVLVVMEKDRQESPRKKRKAPFGWWILVASRHEGTMPQHEGAYRGCCDASSGNVGNQEGAFAAAGC
jgi:hypothetical protein